MTPTRRLIFGTNDVQREKKTKNKPLQCSSIQLARPREETEYSCARKGKRFARTQAASSNTAENKDHPVGRRRWQKSTARLALASNGSLFTLHSSRLSGPFSLSAGNGLKWNEKGAPRSPAAAHLLRLDSGAEIWKREWTVPEKPQWKTGQGTGKKIGDLIWIDR